LCWLILGVIDDIDVERDKVIELLRKELDLGIKIELEENTYIDED